MMKRRKGSAIKVAILLLAAYVFGYDSGRKDEAEADQEKWEKVADKINEAIYNHRDDRHKGESG